MKYCRRMLVCVLVGIALNSRAIASVSSVNDGLYRIIPQRNAFGLLPPVVSRNEPNTPVFSRPKITLAGITGLLAGKLALLILPPIKAGGFRECLLLREGETQDEIQVREIGSKSVIVVNHGEEQALSFEDGLPAPASVPVDQRSPIQMPAAKNLR